MRLLFAFLLPALLALFPFKLFFLSFIFLIPLYLIAFDAKLSRNQVFLTSLAVGFVYHGLAFFWLSKASFQIYGLALAIIVWIFPIYFTFVREFRLRLKNLGLLFSSLLVWWTMNLIFSLTPIHSHAMDLPFITGPLVGLQIVKSVGVVGWQLMVLALQLMIALWMDQERKKVSMMTLAFMMLIGLSFLTGFVQLRIPSKTVREPIALIQHNLQMSPDWRRENHRQVEKVYRELGQKAIEQKPALIVYPLYSLAEDPLRNPEFFSELARELKTPILIAAHIPIEEGGDPFGADYHTMALLFSKSGQMIGKYEAVQKAPEFRKSKEAVAEEYLVLDTPVGKIGILLCFEDSVPRYAKEARLQGAEFLLALSNPGHFVDSKMPQIYLIYDQLRAIETGLPMLRLSAKGYSAVIDQKGRILKQTQLNEQEILYSHP